MAERTNPILVLGSTGTTGRRLVRELRRLGVPVRAASRHPSGDGSDADHVRFDWDDAATHDRALDGVQTVYLLAPPSDPEPGRTMLPFVRLAVDRGATRLVLHSASSIERGGPHLGKVHEAVADSGVEWAVLRPTWFMQNLWNPGHPIGAAVRAGRDIVTASGDGRIPFIDAGDIARVAARVLTDRGDPSDEMILTGPEALGYDDVSALLSRSLGREVRRRAVSVDEAAAWMTSEGVPAPVAQMLAGLDDDVADGAEERVTDTVARVTGHAARSLEDVLTEDDPFQRDQSW